MADILTAAIEGLLLVFAWPNVLYPVVGTLLAMVFAFLPGLGGVTLMALAIPFTFSWDPLPVVLLFGAMVGSALGPSSASVLRTRRISTLKSP